MEILAFFIPTFICFIFFILLRKCRFSNLNTKITICFISFWIAIWIELESVFGYIRDSAGFADFYVLVTLPLIALFLSILFAYIFDSIEIKNKFIRFIYLIFVYSLSLFAAFVIDRCILNIFKILI